MARPLRLEYENALYHVISRGNYRAAVFEQKGAREAFLACLATATQRAGWVVHAYVVMSNHYHLALETPKGNLSEGMRWLQSTYANRFNRFRNERGHVFQGRYKALVVENEDALGAVCHYIHLNPVRAQILPLDRLCEFRASSLRQLSRKTRPDWLDLSTCLRAAGELKDNPGDRKRYLEFLRWLSTDQDEQKRLAFDKMCRGWALGSGEFKKALVRDQKDYLEGSRENLAKEDAEVLELAWELKLEKLLSLVNKDLSDLKAQKKSADWKIAMAAWLKEKTTATNEWIADHLRMGVPSAPSRYVTELKRGQFPAAKKLFEKISKIEG